VLSAGRDFRISDSEISDPGVRDKIRIADSEAEALRGGRSVRQLATYAGLGETEQKTRPRNGRTGRAIAEASGRRLIIGSVDEEGRTFRSTAKWANLAALHDQIFSTQ
jgi:hypothetical protein